MGRVAGGLRHTRPSRLPAFTPVIVGAPALQIVTLGLCDSARALYAPTAWPGYDVAPGNAPVFTGAASPTDTSAAFASFLSAHPGEAIALVPGRVYLMDDRTQVSNLDGWDLYGQGAVIYSQGFYSRNPDLPDSWLRLITCDGWRIRDIELVGPASHQDIVDNYSNYGWSREDWCGIRWDGGHLGRMDRVKGHNWWGDPLYIGARDNSGDQYATPDGVILDHCEFWDAGRNAVSITGGINITITDCEIGNGGLAALDVEPNNSDHPVNHFDCIRTYFYGGDLDGSGSASHDAHGNGYVFYGSAGFAEALDHSIDQCTFDIGAIFYINESGRQGPNNNGVSITNSTAAVHGDATFARTDNITFSNNTNIHKVP